MANVKNNYSLAIDNFQTAKENVALAERIERKNNNKIFRRPNRSFELRQAQVQLYQAQQNLVQSMRQLILDKQTRNDHQQRTINRTMKISLPSCPFPLIQ